MFRLDRGGGRHGLITKRRVCAQPEQGQAMTESDGSPPLFRRLRESVNPYTWVALTFLTVGVAYYFFIP